MYYNIKQGVPIINILLIEDDLELAQILSNYLSKHDMKVIIAEEPFMGLSLITQNEFDLIILDLTLPEIDGLEIIPKIREVSNIPIIISSARDDITDKIIGLERGADDYMPKPYDPRELVTRIKTILRRTHTASIPKEDIPIFQIDLITRMVMFRDEPLELTAAEFDLLSILFQNKNAPVSREQLLYESQHIDDESSIKNIDVIISRIRQKLSKIDDEHSYIKPVRGIGYMLSTRQ